MNTCEAVEEPRPAERDTLLNDFRQTGAFANDQDWALIHYLTIFN